MNKIRTALFYSLLVITTSESFANSDLSQEGSDLKGCLEKQSGAEPTTLGELSTSFGEATLVTADILSAYSLFSNDMGGNPSRPKALGIHLSTSLPATTPTLEEYANATLLLKKGGIFNAYFSLSSSPKWYDKKNTDKKNTDKKNTNKKNTNKKNTDKKGTNCNVDAEKYNKSENFNNPKWRRDYIPDRVYLSLHPVPPLMRLYLTHGLGVKAFKTGLVDNQDGTNDSSDINVAGVFYFGLGANGPIWDGENNVDFGPAGTLDFQFVWTYTYINPDSLRKLYGDASINESDIYAGTAKLSLIVTNRVSIELEYSAPLSDSLDFMSETIHFNVAYATK